MNFPAVLGLAAVIGGFVTVVVAGVGISALVNSGTTRLTEAAVRGTAIVIPSMLIIGLVAARVGIFDRWLLLPLLLAAAIGVRTIAVSHKPTTPSLHVSIGLVVAATAVWLRRSPVYFLGDWTDFGAYVNRGNSIADGGAPGAYFPPLTEVAVAFGHLGFSEPLAIWIIPLLSSLTALFGAAVSYELTASRNSALLAGALLSIHPVAVWFGRLPSSESLYSLLSLIAVYQLIDLSRQGARWSLALTVFAMVVTRPNGIILIVPVVATIVVGCLSSREGARWSGAIIPVAAGWLAGVLWLVNFGFIRGVLVSVSNMTGRDAGQLEDLVTNSWVQVLAVMALGAFAFAAQRAFTKLPVSPRAPAALIATAAIGSAIAIVALGKLSGLRDGLSSLGPATLALALAGGVLVMWTQRFDLAPFTALVSPAVLWGFVYAIQFDGPLPHYVYLYWERHLFPNVSVALLILAGCTGLLLDALKPAVLTAALLTFTVAVVAAVDDYASDLGLQHTRQYHGEDFYEGLANIADQLPPDAVVSYEGVPADRIWATYFFFYPNTYRVVASPLQQTFDVTFDNLPTEPRDPDPQTTGTQATHRLIVALEDDRNPATEEQVIPLSLLPRNSVNGEQWNEWQLFVRVEEL